jgi:hypothetical protein
MAEKSKAKSSQFYFSIPFLVFIAFALLIAALQLSITDKINSSPTGFASIITAKDAANSNEFFDATGNLKQEYISEINQNIGGVPEYIFKLFGSDNINIYVELNDGSTSVYNVTTQQNKVVQLGKGINEKANIEVRLSENVIEGIINSKEPLKEFLDAFNSGKIKYKGIGVEGKVKETGVGVTVGILGAINGIISFFGQMFM